MHAFISFFRLDVLFRSFSPSEQKTYRAFIEWEQCDCGRKPTAGCARLFEKSVTKLAEDGMPDAAWVWACNIKVIDGTTILVKAAECVPPKNGREALEELGRSLGCKTLIWQRLKRGKLILKSFQL